MNNGLGPLQFLDTETAKSVSLGTPYYDAQRGRVYKYAKAGAAQDPGKLMVQATHSTDYADLAPTAAEAIGEQNPVLTLSSSALTADQFQDGFFVVNTGGIMYPIEGHNAYDAAATTAQIDLTYPLVAALTTSSDIDLVLNKYASVVLSVTDQADAPVGVWNVSIASGSFGMIQTWGPCAVWQDTTNGIGDSLVTGSGTAGQVEVEDAAGEPLIGTQGPYAGGDGNYQLVYLRIEP